MISRAQKSEEKRVAPWGMVVAVLIFSESASRRSALLLFALGGAGSLACGSGCRHEAAERGSVGTPDLPGAGSARVGNDDPRGVENQPDWSSMARDLRVRVEPRMPKELPADRAAACAQMLEAAMVFYDTTEASPERRAKRLQELADTYEDDLRGCIAHTSIQAALCVTILLGDRDSEYPWLLDQCDRGFPSGGSPSASTPTAAG